VPRFGRFFKDPMTISNSAYLTGIEHIVFDWNGTLLDDIDLAVASVNLCGARFGVAQIGRDKYRETFDFPISEFYLRLGFDFNRTPFAKVVELYVAHFDANVARCPLHDGVLALLNVANDAGIGMSVLSASHQDVLVRTLGAMDLLGRFANVIGLTNNLATSKVAEAIRLRQRLTVAPSSTLFIGDTLHDCEVALAVGWKPLLVSSGHQATSRLLPSGAPVLAGLIDLLPIGSRRELPLRAGRRSGQRSG
jgi:phosphoglycolate phosphatase